MTDRINEWGSALQPWDGEPAASAEPGSDDAPAGRAASSPRLSADASNLDIYRATLGRVGLLSASDEVELAQTMRRSRAALVENLSQISEVLDRYAEALRAALAGTRRMSEVLHAPFSSFQVDDGPKGGRTVRQAAGRYLELHADWRRSDSRAGRARVAAQLVRLEPGLQFLWEAVDGLDEVEAADRPLVARCRSAAAQYREAHRRMVEGNLRLAYAVAQKYVGNGVEAEDLIQAANVGLLRAAEKFDPDLGFKFSTYAYQWIRQSLSKALADTSRTIRIAAHLHDTVVRLRQAGRRMEQSLGRAPSAAELAEETGVSEEKVTRALEAGQRALSLDSPVPELGDVSYAEMLDDPQADPFGHASSEELEERVRGLVGRLPRREAFIISMRHGIGVSEPRTLEEIGAMLDITRERTRQLESRAIERLRKWAAEDLAASIHEAA